MKSIIEQIKFLNITILPIFGIKSLIDYKSIVYKSQINSDILHKISNIVSKIKEIYPVKEFNFHKSDNKVTSVSQAYNILKKCLSIVGVYYVEEIVDHKKVLRLMDKNIVLENYIEKLKMSEIRNYSQNDTIKYPNDIPEGKIKETLRHQEYEERKKLGNILQQGVKKIEEENYFTKIGCDNFYNSTITLDCCKENNCGIYIKFTSVIKNNKQVLSQEYIDDLFEGMIYQIIVNDNIAYQSKFKNGVNIFPDNIVIPFRVAIYNDKKFKLKLEHEISKQILDLINIDIKVNKVIFKKRIQDTLKTSTIYIALTEKVFWNITGGQIEVKQVPEKKLSKKDPFDDYKNNYDVDVINEYKYAIAKKKSINGKLDRRDLIIPLICGYQFSAIHFLNNVYSNIVKRVDSWNEFTYKFCNFFDSEYDISIHIPNNSIFDLLPTQHNLEVYIGYDDDDKYIIKCQWELDIMKDENIIKINNYTQNNQLHMCFKLSYISIKLRILDSILDEDLINTLMRSITISSCGVFWDEEHRKKLIDHKGLDIVPVSCFCHMIEK